MARTKIVFMGPTMEVSEARLYCNALYLPPIKRGELIDVVDTYNPTHVLVLDGLFFQQRAVLHRELIAILRMGVCVWGASSMGALRAAELSLERMTGIGTIFEWYRSGYIDGDDEVAVVHCYFSTKII